MKRVAIAIAALLPSVLILCACAPLAHAATVGYWRFENDLVDLSGNGNDAAATGTAFTSAVFGTPVPATGAANSASLELDNNYSLTVPPFTDADHYLTVPHDASLNIATGSFTIEAYVQLDTPGDNDVRQYVVQKKDAGFAEGASSYIFLAKAGNLPGGPGDKSLMALMLTDGAATYKIFSTLGVGDTDWHYTSVALDRTTGDVRFMLDDQTDLQPGAAAGTEFDGIDNDDALYIGAHPTGVSTDPPNFGLVGGLDELRISNEYLAQGELLPVPEPAALVLALPAVIIMAAFLMRAATRLPSRLEKNQCIRTSHVAAFCKRPRPERRRCWPAASTANWRLRTRIRRTKS